MLITQSNCFINDVIRELANEQWVSMVIIRWLGEQNAYIKIFENAFSGGNSRLQCLNHQKKNEFCCRKIFRKKLSYIAVHAAFRQRFNHAPPCKKTIQRNVKKYHSHGRSLKRKNKILGDEGLFVMKRTSK